MDLIEGNAFWKIFNTYKYVVKIKLSAEDVRYFSEF